jgi:succinylglutamic semialdehyde dehydrogenase
MNKISFPVQSYVSGRFQSSRQGRLWHRQNPYRLDQSLYSWTEDLELLDEAVIDAKKGFQVWRSYSLEKRLEYLERLKTSLQKREKEIATAISLESGKAFWESTVEAQALASKIDITREISLPMMKQMEGFGRQTSSSEFRFHPHGICAVYGPFNFPLHLAHGHIVPALMMGNVVLFKPSEYTNASASLYSQAFEEAGFPSGVYQCVLGGAQLGENISRHPDVDAIFFTGSALVGRKITEASFETHGDFRRLIALELGGKNASIVHEDADLDLAVASCLFSAYATTGQRCTCSSRIFVHQRLIKDFEKRFLQKLTQLSYGDPFQSQTFMGPLIHPASLTNFLKHLETARSEGFESLKESETVDSNSCVVSPSLYRSSNPHRDHLQSSLQQEFFGPNSILIPYERTEDLVTWHEATPYGLAASVFSSSAAFFDRMDHELKVGLLNWNRPSVGASSKLPFGGWKASGNHWPAGSFASLYCARPRSYVTAESNPGLSHLPQNIQNLWMTEK